MVGVGTGIEVGIEGEPETIASADSPATTAGAEGPVPWMVMGLLRVQVDEGDVRWAGRGARPRAGARAAREAPPSAGVERGGNGGADGVRLPHEADAGAPRVCRL